MRPSYTRAPIAALVAALAALTAAGCGSEPSGTLPETDSSALFWSLTASHRAVTLALVEPHRTIALTATPRTHSGTEITGLPTAAFRALNASVVGVSGEGVVTARARGATSIIASLTAGGVTHHDTIAVTVTATASGSPPADFEVVVPQIVSVGLYNESFPAALQARMTSEAGTPIGGVAVVYESLDPTTLIVNRTTGRLDPIRAGKVRVAATSTAYGVAMSDTVVVPVSPPMLQMVMTPTERTADGRTERVFSPGSVTVVAGGSVAFLNGTVVDYPTDPIDITFDDPAGVAEDELICRCGAGNIEPFVTPLFQLFSTMRSFPTPGTYTYHSVATGQTGRVIVVPAQ